MYDRKSRIIIIVCIALIALVAGLYMGWRYWVVQGQPHTHQEKFAEDNDNGYTITVPYFRVGEDGNVSDGVASLDLNMAMSESGKEIGVMKAQRYADASLIAFESLNDIDRHVVRVSRVGGLPVGGRYVMGIRGTDYMASKSALAVELRKNAGEADAGKILPDTWVLHDKAQREALLVEAAKMSNDVFICKKNIQRQEGASILRGADMAEHLELVKDDNPPYVVCQRVLQNPLIIGGRKVNLRVYMLVVVRPVAEGGGGDRAVEFWAYPNGFMYYTPKPWEAMSTDPDKIITTGYIDRKVYEENPLTLMDLKRYMGDAAYDVMWVHTLGALGTIKRAYVNLLRSANASDGLKGVTQFMVYGVDVAPAADLSVKIMEVNKGPDMSYKDTRDREVKYNMALDMYKVVLGWSDRKGPEFIAL